MICIQEGKRDGRDIILVDITVIVIVIVVIVVIIVIVVVVVVIVGIVDYTKAITVTVTSTVGSLIWVTLISLYRCILGKGWLE